MRWRIRLQKKPAIKYFPRTARSREIIITVSAGTTTVGAARRGRRDHSGVARRNRLRPILPETQAGTGHQHLLCLRQADLPKVHAAVWPRLFRLLPESGGTTRRPGSCLRRAEVCRTGKRMAENETCPGGNRRGGGVALRRLWLVCVRRLQAAHALLAQDFKGGPAGPVSTALNHRTAPAARQQARAHQCRQRKGNLIKHAADGETAADPGPGAG